MRRVEIFCLTILLVCGLLMGCTQMSAEEIAKKMEEKYDAIKDMKGTMVITTEFQGEKQIQVINFSYKKPNKWRSEDANSTIVSNGSVVWIYDKRKNEVIITKLPETKKPEFDYGKIIEDLLEKNDVKLLGVENVLGRNCYVIEVTPKNKTFYVKQKLWIDKEFWYPIRIEINYGEFNSIIEYRNIQFNTGIRGEEFEFKPPEGAKIIEKEFKLPKKLTIEEAQKLVNFTIINPTYTAGYEFNYAMVFKFGGTEKVSLYYRKGEKYLTIVESIGVVRSLPNSTKVKIGNVDGELTEMFGLKVLKFNCNNISITIAGKLSEDKLIEIAKSMTHKSTLKSEQKMSVTTVYFFYSLKCPHCKEIKPYITNLTKEYSNIRFVYCDVNDCSGECREIMEKYRIMFVPTAVVIGKNNTTILTGSTNIKNELERVLSES